VPEQIGTAYDLWFAYQLSRTGLGMWYSSERLARHRVHQERLSAGDRFDLPLLHCYERWADEPGLEQLRPQLRRAAGHRATGAGLTALEGGGDRAAARRLLLQGARDAPSPRALLALALSSSPSALRRAHGVATAGRRMLRRPQ
jgi:hypothetical protein